jgi:3-oxoacyl-[acyl-carrier protein] reductase
MLARNLVLELSPHKITVNCVAPGATLTPRNLADDPNYETVWGRLTPTQQAMRPDDIANAALFLLSPQAAQITGQTIVVDGGWSVTSPTPALDFVQTTNK